MPPPYEKHIFVCTNKRPDGSPKGCCATKGADEVRARFRIELEKHGLRGQIRPNASGCLDICERGVGVVVYPDGVWYGQVKPDDVADIVEQHLVKGEPVERLRIKEYETTKKD